MIYIIYIIYLYNSFHVFMPSKLDFALYTYEVEVARSRQSTPIFIWLYGLLSPLVVH